jgi:cytosine/uracil/thiamine/allantoin permease
MKVDRIRQLFALLAPLALLCAWALVIWVALHVSTIVLETLDMIVELAAISP